MLLSNLPTLVPVPFANSGTKNAIPIPSQIGVTPGAASMTDGFPPLTFTPIAGGGIPPAGGDFNGILNLITAQLQWDNAGGFYPYNASFSSTVGGYPLGAVLARVDGTGFWLSTIDGNTNNPESTTNGWVPINNQGATTLSGLVNSNVTLTALQAAKDLIVLSGTITGNLNIVFPAIIRNWRVIDLTTGAFTITLKTASGTGVVSNQNATCVQSIQCDGTNILSPMTNAALTGTPTAPTATAGSNNLQVANTAFVANAIHGKFLRRSWFQGTNGGFSPTTGQGGQTSGSYTVPSDISFIIVKCVGGGAGGGGCQDTGTGNQYLAGAGGSGANYVEKKLTVAQLGGVGAVVNWLVGNNGAGGKTVAAGVNTPTTGGNGGDTVFGTGLASPVTAKGGIGGQGQVLNNSANGAAPPTLTGNNGDFAIQGTAGSAASASNSLTIAKSGDGGGTAFGPGTGGFMQLGSITIPSGFNPSSPGASGAGSVQLTVGVGGNTFQGTPGAVGLIIIEEYA